MNIHWKNWSEAETEAQVVWPPDEKIRPTEKDLDTGKD